MQTAEYLEGLAAHIATAVRGAIANGESASSLARVAGLARTTFLTKLDHPATFKLLELVRLCVHLGIDYVDVFRGRDAA